MEGSKPTDNTPDHAGIRLPPPLIFLTLLVAGLWVDSPWFEGQLAAIELTVGGGLLTILGFALMLPSVLRHSRAGTEVEPWKPTTTIITTGLYAWSRNPIYLGMVLAHAGLAISGGSLAAFGTLVICIPIIRYYVIAREERYLEGKFGAVYTDYKQHVRRWL